MNEPKHAAGGWTLEDYEWLEKTGVGVFTYSHPEVGIRRVERAQRKYHRG